MRHLIKIVISKEFSSYTSHEWHLDWDAFEGDVEQRLSALCYWVQEYTRLQRVFSLSLPDHFFGPNVGEAFRDELLIVLALYGVDS